MPIANEMIAKMPARIANRLINVSKGELDRLFNQKITPRRFWNTLAFSVAPAYVTILAYNCTFIMPFIFAGLTNCHDYPP